MLKAFAFRNKKLQLRKNASIQFGVRSYSRPSNVMNVLHSQRNRSSPTSSWSSPNDRIVRNVFSSNSVHAWTLLEACLEQENMTRAESVLLGLSEISGSSDIALAVNTFLQKLIDINEKRPEVPINWLKRIEFQIPKFQPNDATNALLLRNACSNGPGGPTLLQSFVEKYSKSKVLNLLRQFEILGAENIAKVMSVADIKPNELDETTKKVLEINQSEAYGAKSDADTSTESSGTDSSELSSSSTSSENTPAGTVDSASSSIKLAEPIRKTGFETLEPTESAGLVAVRHVLSGLKYRSQAEKRGISELTTLADLPHVQNKSIEDVDFFDMWKQLKTPEEKEKFDAILEEINERRQRNVETRGLEAARMRWRQMFEQMCELDKTGSTKVQLKGLDTLLWEWNQAMMPLVDAEIKRLKLLTPYNKYSEVPKSIINEHFAGMKQSAIAERIEYAPYLLLAKPENLPAMTMMELLRINAKGRDHLRATKAILSVGKNVEREYKLEVRKRNIKNSGGKSAFKETPAPIAASTTDSNGNMVSEDTLITPRTLRQRVESMTHAWPDTIRIKIGSLLVNMLMQTARVRVSGTDPVSGKKVRGTSPAFHHTYQYQNGTSIGIIRPHKVVANYLSGDRIAIQPQQLPMLCKPRQWTRWDSGGYWYTPSTIVRSKDSPEQTAYIAAASDRGRIQKVFDGLNVLGEVPWTINKDIFKVVSHIWNTKKEFLDIPPHVSSVPDLSGIPVPPRNSDPSVLRDYRRQCREVTLENGSLYSQRCDLNYKLDIARALLGERFYMPHNVDFRGRAYPLSPHFNHLGNDVSRSLLIFWNGRRLGEEGFWWLKVHLANLFGLNKATHAERVKFVDEHIDTVVNVAKDPLNPQNDWWTHADSPFQALATCMEIKNALDHPDGPENFESHLTVHQDGSCNGLQHYAALGGDYEGAREVNLEVADRPQDVYSRVLEIVKLKVENESDLSSKQLSEMLLPVLSRKVVKQTVMTHVYGVTYIGARNQISNRLREIEAFPKELVFKGASYLAKLILEAVRELFESAHEIQDWLGDNATRISRAIVSDTDLKDADQKFVSSVIWTSPLGLPIVQPYRKEKMKLVKTELQTISITDPYSFQGVNARKQRTAFPPNYIHSLDATHMLMSALKCHDDNIAFAAVHDSYWTHAADISTLNKNLRECFVKLHSESLIQKLKDEFQVRYGNHLEVVKIPKNCEVGKQIRKLHDSYSLQKYGKVTKLNIADQVELELTRDHDKDDDLTPLDVMKALSTEEIDQLIREVELGKPKKAAPRMKSSEHAGSGLDATIKEAEEQECIAIEAAEMEGGDEIEEEIISKRGAHTGFEVLVPVRIPEIPSRGSFDVKNVLRSPYFFS